MQVIQKSLDERRPARGFLLPDLDVHQLRELQKLGREMVQCEPQVIQLPALRLRVPRIAIRGADPGQITGRARRISPLRQIHTVFDECFHRVHGLIAFHEDAAEGFPFGFEAFAQGRCGGGADELLDGGEE